MHCAVLYCIEHCIETLHRILIVVPRNRILNNAYLPGSKRLKLGFDEPFGELTLSASKYFVLSSK